uniref:Cyclic nucleotide-binding protein n=1 Tax=Rhodopseudomonas palustris (strain BisA53) TaxID=316055 RepID=Q07P66_RHOP5
MASYRQSPNQLLASLPAWEFELIRPDIRTSLLTLGDVLVEPGAELELVYFPHGGVISSFVNLTDGEAIEVGMFGRDGVFGAAAVLNGGVSPTAAIVQYPGAATVIEARRFESVAIRSPTLQSLIMQHQWIDFMQAEQMIACNASHDVSSRVSGRLLRLRDLAQSDRLPVTQETLARMLGVRRNSVSLAAGALQDAGAIRYSRGQVEIVNAHVLTDRCCECYEVSKSHNLRRHRAPRLSLPAAY